MSQRNKHKKQWNDIGLTDLRSLPAECRLDSPVIIEQARNQSEALQVLLTEFGLEDQHDINQINTPIGSIDVEGRHLCHIVEKRKDARERYIHHALATINDPFEVWRSVYDNGTVKFQFIGAFSSKPQMLVIVAQHEKYTLWNFMQMDARRLNKHRIGEIIYQRKRATE